MRVAWKEEAAIEGAALGVTEQKEMLKGRSYRKSMKSKTEYAGVVASKLHGVARFWCWEQPQRGSIRARTELQSLFTKDEQSQKKGNTLSIKPRS